MRLILTAILLLLCPLGGPGFAAPWVKQGHADFSTADWQREPITNLSGEWQMYWNQLLTPEAIEAGQGKLSGYVPLEQEWQKTELPDVNIHRIGSATYHMTFHAPKSMELMLGLPILNSASRVWINGEIKQEFGKPSLTSADEVPFIRTNRVKFQAQEGKNHITIQMSNHHFWYGGASLPARIGLPDAFHREHLKALVGDAMTFGFLLFMAIYHIYIRMLLKRSNGALYFGVVCLVIAFRMGFVGDGQMFYQIWPDAAMSLRYFVEYLGVALGMAFMLSFIRELYPHEAKPILFLPPIYLATAWAAFIIVAPALYYPAVLEFFQIIIMATGFITIGVAFVAAKHRRDGALLLVTCNLLFFLSVANDIAYHHRVFESIILIHYGMMFLMGSQALILAKRFTLAFDRAEKAEQEVTKLNQGLEQKIRERTEQINTILSHVRSGFLLVDRQSHLQTGFTSSCETILGQALQVGSSLPNQLGFTGHLAMQFIMAIQQIFDSDLPTEVAMQQLPSRFPMGKRMIGLQAAAVKNRETGQVTAVLLTINDVTDLVAAEEGLQRADILIHILEDQDAFRIFLADFKKDLDAATQAIIQGDGIALHSILHTMKGNAASFNLNDWVRRLHQLEDNDPISTTDIQNVAQHVRQFLRENEGILHLDFDQPMRSVFGVDQNDLNALKETLVPVASPVALARVENWSRSVQSLPLKSYTTPLGPMVRRVSGQLNKDVNLVVEGADAKVANAYAPLLTTLPHLIRNSLVHGIEEAEDRGDKPRQATISLRFTLQIDGGLSISISDDGRGLDPVRIRENAEAQGLIAKGQEISDENLFALIFHPNFSTAERITDLAGRGMGLAAVASAVHDLGGRYEIRSIRNEGFHLHITVPSPSPQRLNRAV